MRNDHLLLHRLLGTFCNEHLFNGIVEDAEHNQTAFTFSKLLNPATSNHDRSSPGKNSTKSLPHSPFRTLPHCLTLLHLSSPGPLHLLHNAVHSTSIFLIFSVSRTSENTKTIATAVLITVKLCLLSLTTHLYGDAWSGNMKTTFFSTDSRVMRNFVSLTTSTKLALSW